MDLGKERVGVSLFVSPATVMAVVEAL